MLNGELVFLIWALSGIGAALIVAFSINQYILQKQSRLVECENMKILEVMPLNKRSLIYLVEIGKKNFAISVSKGVSQVISVVDEISTTKSDETVIASFIVSPQEQTKRTFGMRRGIVNPKKDATMGIKEQILEATKTKDEEFKDVFSSVMHEPKEEVVVGFNYKSIDDVLARIEERKSKSH